MMQIGLIGISAGAAAALLFASLQSGSLLSIVLFYLSPMPIMIAAMGWSHIAGLVAALSGGLSLAVAFDSYFAFAFMVCAAVPAWWLGYLALLARPGASPETLEWYPPGRIVLWAAGAAAIATVVMALAAFGADAESFNKALTAFLNTAEERFRNANNLGSQKTINTEMLALVMPSVVASLNTVILLVNASLAARVVRLSGQLRRPWPELPMIAFPRTAPILLAAALGGLFLTGILGIASGIFAGALTMAFAILGIAVLHVITRGNAARSIVLCLVYIAAVLFTWPAIIVLALMGLVETVFDLRGRIAAIRTPPTTTRT